MEIDKTIFKSIDVDLLKEAPYNVPGRTNEDDEGIQTLAANIREQNGILQTLVVIEPEGDDPRHEIVCGNRRWKAAQIAGIRILPCQVKSKHIKPSDRRIMNVTENVLREDLSNDQLFDGLLEILKAYNQNTTLVATKLSWNESRVMDILKYGALDPLLKAEANKSPEDFKNTLATAGLTSEKALELIQLARLEELPNRTVTNIAENLKNDPKLEPKEALKSIKSRGTRITITLDGEWNEILSLAVMRKDTTRMRYAEEALKERLVRDGYSSSAQVATPVVQ